MYLKCLNVANRLLYNVVVLLKINPMKRFIQWLKELALSFVPRTKPKDTAMKISNDIFMDDNDLGYC